MVDGPEGYRAVLSAMDYFKLVKGERVRFYSLLDALMTDESDLAFKRDVMLFINTLVNRHDTRTVQYRYYVYTESPEDYFAKKKWQHLAHAVLQRNIRIFTGLTLGFDQSKSKALS